MHSTLFTIGPLTLHSYGLMMAIAFIACWHLGVWICRRDGIKSDLVTGLMTTMMLSGILGARAAYVIEHWRSEFAGNLLEIVRVDHGGLMFYGGLILAVATFFVYCHVKRLPPFRAADIFALLVPLGHALGRVGCFLHGCCYGKLAKGAWGVSFPVRSPAWHEQLEAGLIKPDALQSLPVVPTQLIESAACLALFAILTTVYVKRHPRAAAVAKPEVKGGMVAGLYFSLYAFMRFGLEYLRGDPRATIGPLSIGQTISLGMLTIGVGMIVYALKRPPRAESKR